MNGSRRDFLKTASAGAVGAIGFPTIVRSSVFGAAAPSNRVVIGSLGVGSRGNGVLSGFMRRYADVLPWRADQGLGGRVLRQRRLRRLRAARGRTRPRGH
ncbi:MAG: twin-arginine translocation signal domain-containing protein [Planctomycetota bacterium]